ncbi:hypothetical protein SAMN05216267_103416 [Actinacidiphila rubida]|uniref:Allene oxide cyclase barrel-like domain-containing protein n=2 Tax=Actinacidiphila rubida TaxID=310780 RepID=A0A1H8RDC2_9ACTN|nr:hypothetical protein [Actinacidiphila rubida]SEO64410.1 hypothetical protein SAMN05216267_103416 [Actinacidiphila rubida]
MRPLHRTAALTACVAAALAATLAPAGPAQAATPAPQVTGTLPGPWQPYRSKPFVDAAGDVCDFALRGDVVEDGEQIRTLAVDAAGTPTAQEVTGPLVLRYTDEATGAFVDRDLAGTAWLFHHPDGSQTWLVAGHLGLGIHAANPYQPRGYSVVGGVLALSIGTDHFPHVTAHAGPTEDVCATLTSMPPSS